MRLVPQHEHVEIVSPPVVVARFARVVSVARKPLVVLTRDDGVTRAIASHAERP